MIEPSLAKKIGLPTAILFALLLSANCGVATQPKPEGTEQKQDAGSTKESLIETYTERQHEKTLEPTPDTTPNPPEQKPEPHTPEKNADKESQPPETQTEVTPEPSPSERKPDNTPPRKCDNGLKDPGETNIDCGGGCPACVDKITQYGITWTFDRGYRTGKFANGDHWVLGPIKLKALTPTPKDGLHGFEINPTSPSKQPYDKRQSSYDAKLMPKLPGAAAPLSVPEGSIVSTISYPADGGGCGGRSGYWAAAIGTCTRSYLKSAAILTVLKKIPPKDAFRPAYMGTDKTIKHRASDLDLKKLGNLAPVAATPSPDSYQRAFERPWIDHIRGWSGAYLHPGDNMHNYGREIAKTIGTAALILNIDISKLPNKPSKQVLLIRFVQLGIDLTGMADNGQSWPHDGGHGMGRKIPILFAGLLLNDKHMQEAAKWTTSSVCVGGVNGTKGSPFQEDSATFYVSDAEVKMTASSAWKPDNRATPKAYTSKDKGIPEWGIRHSCKPQADNFHWSATYRPINGAGYAGFVLAAHIMGLRKMWNHPPLFDFEDRWSEITGNKTGTNDWTTFFLNMWKQYRGNYGCRWTRDNPSDTYSQGHYVCGTQKVKCTWQQSSCSSCKTAKTCADYPDQRSRDYDPCSLKCNP